MNNTLRKHGKRKAGSWNAPRTKFGKRAGHKANRRLKINQD